MFTNYLLVTRDNTESKIKENPKIALADFRWGYVYLCWLHIILFIGYYYYNIYRVGTSAG